MKKTLLLFLMLSAVAMSQHDGSTDPASWDLGLSTLEADVVLEALDLTRIHQEDLVNDRDKTHPWRYGIERELSLDMSELGSWITLDNGDRIWRARIISQNALNLSINFNDFYLPIGATIHLFNDDQNDVVTSRTSGDRNTISPLGSWFIRGEAINIEYFELANTNENVKLEIGGIIHGYRLGKVNRFIDEKRGLNDSGYCNYDVNCLIGEDFDTYKDGVKKAVALLNLGNGFLCSASLVNNTQQDKTPYLLTANHCLEGSDPALWSVRFNWMSPGPICGESDDSQDLQTNFTLSGAILRASNEMSDFALVEMITDIPQAWDVSFAGWDRTDELPDFEVGIHHPNGDIMKISRDNSGAVHENAEGKEVWLIGGVSAGSGDGWEIGTTESGSSGSPLFNQNGLIIGQLYAGNSFCENNENNNDFDVYGRFATSWDFGSTGSTRLSEWLDPAETGVNTIITLQNILNIPDNEIIGALEIYPNPVSDQLTVMNSRYPKLRYSFYDILGQEIYAGAMANTLNYVSVANLSNGMYFLKLVDGDSDATITKKIMVQK
ncbi:MAG: lysyl endopeptidase [Planctomycetota bacterium]|jgi:lysyl endopeptidase|uniref:T9SS type A sorting domain-containing protein n=1 Tax=Patiriisocius sp. Uisw_047 TaxID=3230969 RepID=UPI0039E88A26